MEQTTVAAAALAAAQTTSQAVAPPAAPGSMAMHMELALLENKRRGFMDYYEKEKKAIEARYAINGGGQGSSTQQQNGGAAVMTSQQQQQQQQQATFPAGLNWQGVSGMNMWNVMGMQQAMQNNANQMIIPGQMGRAGSVAVPSPGSLMGIQMHNGAPVPVSLVSHGTQMYTFPQMPPGKQEEFSNQAQARLSGPGPTAGGKRRRERESGGHSSSAGQKNPSNTSKHAKKDASMAKRHPKETKKGNVTYKRPTDSYAQLAANAIMHIPNECATVKQIYDWVEATHPFYKHQGATWWKNCIRHNLSLKKCFVRHFNAGGAGVHLWGLDKTQLDELGSSELKRRASAQKAQEKQGAAEQQGTPLRGHAIISQVLPNHGINPPPAPPAESDNGAAKMLLEFGGTKGRSTTPPALPPPESAKTR